jgi:uncharacterized protein YdhG (YjbR/CyaY superfamily)
LSHDFALKARKKSACFFAKIWVIVMKEYKTIDQYLKQFSPEVASKLTALREMIADTVPEATEAIRYGLPTFQLNGNLLHFGGYKTHIGVYPAPSGIEAFEKELTPYQKGKGTLQFPLDKDLPLSLIKKIVLFRVKENLAKKKK